MDAQNKNTKKISIGLPVYNGEKFIRKRLESILSQTFRDFELIISDNGSTDSTPNICEEFVKKDDRIRFFEQERNMGIVWNFNFVLDKANCEYFVWASVDDVWLPEFLEENLRILENDKKSVGSVSKIEYYGGKWDVPQDSFLKKMKCTSYEDCPKSSSYEQRAKFYLIYPYCENIYGLFRTKELKKSIVRRTMVGLDKAILLSVLRHGRINILDKVLMRRYARGFSVLTPLMDRLSQFNSYGFLGKIFPYLPFTFWCAKELGIKIFLKNLEYFIRINYGKERLLLRDFVRSKKNKNPKIID